MAPPSFESPPLSPPPAGSGRKQSCHKCSALYGSAAFSRSVAGSCVAHPLPHWLRVPAHGAFRQCGCRAAEGVHGWVASGGEEAELPVLAAPGSMDVGELLSYQVGGRGESGRRTLIRTCVAGRRTRAPSSHLPHPTSRARAPSLLMPPGSEPLIALRSLARPSCALSMYFIPFHRSSPFSTRRGSSSPYPWARAPSTLLYKQPLPLSSSPVIEFAVMGERWSVHLSPNFTDWLCGFWTSYSILFEPQVLYV